jgi:hypothetical protein
VDSNQPLSSGIGHVGTAFQGIRLGYGSPVSLGDRGTSWNSYDFLGLALSKSPRETGAFSFLRSRGRGAARKDHDDHALHLKITNLCRLV